MSASVRIDPSTGPATVAMPARPVNAPIALARSSGAYITWMLDITCGIIAAAPSPCSARAADQPVGVGRQPARGGHQR